MAQALPSKSSLIVLESVIAALRAGSRDFGAGADAQAITVLDRLGIADLAMEPLGGGQRQMDSLAQAIVRDPCVLLLDEPKIALALARQARLRGNCAHWPLKGRSPRPAAPGQPAHPRAVRLRPDPLSSVGRRHGVRASVRYRPGCRDGACGAPCSTPMWPPIAAPPGTATIMRCGIGPSVPRCAPMVLPERRRLPRRSRA